jgi:hypothetical protein
LKPGNLNPQKGIRKTMDKLKGWWDSLPNTIQSLILFVVLAAIDGIKYYAVGNVDITDALVVFGATFYNQFTSHRVAKVTSAQFVQAIVSEVEQPYATQIIAKAKGAKDVPEGEGK